MSELNKDVLFLIFEELQDIGESALYHSLLVKKTWFEVAVPILWKNPWKYLNVKKEIFLLNVIISHLSDESREKLILLPNSYQKPLLDYIGFCKHLDLNELERIIEDFYDNPIIKNEIFNHFINRSTTFTHLYLPDQIDLQIHLISRAESSLSELEFLRCSTATNENILVALSKICKSIKELEVSVTNRNDGTTALIEAQNKLNKVRFNFQLSYMEDESFNKSIENSLNKHADIIQHFNINRNTLARSLSSFNNLKSLELIALYITTWDQLDNISLPTLQILMAKNIPVRNITNVIKQTKRLTEIKIDFAPDPTLIRCIHQHCPNLKYVRIPFNNNCILELEKLLLNCQSLVGLCIFHNNLGEATDCDQIFEILTRSSPNSLFKFKFQFNKITVESLKFFFHSWKGRQPMLLHLNEVYSNLIETYEFIGVIKKYHYVGDYNSFEDFEWIKPRFPPKKLLSLI